MKIYILPVSEKFRPASQPFIYPAHNRDYSMEQDFYEYLLRHPELIAKHPDDADFHYLPVFWTRWHLNHDYGKTGLDELAAEIDRVLVDTKKTFVVCMYDDGPIVDVKDATLFLSSRKTDKEIDIPLLSEPIPMPRFWLPRKKYLAVFLGRKENHGIRKELFEQLEGRKDIFMFDGNRGMKFYRKKMLQSYIALCPRGYGSSSFRFYEAMQMGLVPMLIGDIDSRAFRYLIDWDKVSLYAQSAKDVPEILSGLEKEKLKAMGAEARRLWQDLRYQRWPAYVVKVLEKKGRSEAE